MADSNSGNSFLRFRNNNINNARGAERALLLQQPAASPPRPGPAPQPLEVKPWHVLAALAALVLLALLGLGITAVVQSSKAADKTCAAPADDAAADAAAINSLELLHRLQALISELGDELTEGVDDANRGIAALSLAIPPPSSTPPPSSSTGPTLCNLTAASIVAQCPSVLGTCVDFDGWWTAACPYAALSLRAPAFAIDAPSDAYAYLTLHCPGGDASPIVDRSELLQYVRQLSVFNQTSLAGSVANGGAGFVDWVSAGDVNASRVQLRAHTVDPAAGELVVQYSCNGAAAKTTPQPVCNVVPTKYNRELPSPALSTCPAAVEPLLQCNTNAECYGRFFNGSGPFGLSLGSLCVANRCAPLPWGALNLPSNVYGIFDGAQCIVNFGDIDAQFGGSIVSNRSRSCGIGALRNCSDPNACPPQILGRMVCNIENPDRWFDCSCGGSTGSCTSDPSDTYRPPAYPSSNFYCTADSECLERYPGTSSLCLAGRCQANAIFGNNGPGLDAPCLRDLTNLDLLIGVQLGPTTFGPFCPTGPNSGGRCNNLCIEGVGANTGFGLQCVAPPGAGYFPCNCDARYTVDAPYSKTCATDVGPCSSYQMCEAALPVTALAAAEQTCVYRFCSASDPTRCSEAGEFRVPPSPTSTSLKQFSFVSSSAVSTRLAQRLADIDPVDSTVVDGTAVLRRMSDYRHEASRRRPSLVGIFGDNVRLGGAWREAALPYHEGLAFKEYADQFSGVYGGGADYRQLFRDAGGLYAWHENEVFVGGDWDARLAASVHQFTNRSFATSLAASQSDLPASGDYTGCAGRPRFTVRDHGANVRIINVDTRSCASPAPAEACPLPVFFACVPFFPSSLGRVDYAASLPGSVRAAIYRATLDVEFGFPFTQFCVSPTVAPACAAAIASSSRTKLGATQLAALKQAISVVGNRVVFVVSPDMLGEAGPVVQAGAWAGYESERRDLMQHIASSGKNVVFLSSGLQTSEGPLYVPSALTRTAADQPVAYEFTTYPILDESLASTLTQPFVVDNVMQILKTNASLRSVQYSKQTFAATHVDVDRCTVVLTAHDADGHVVVDAFEPARVVQSAVPLRSIGACSAAPLPVCVWPQTTGCTPCRTSAACPSGGPRTFTYCQGGTVCRSVENCEPPQTPTPVTFVVDDLLGRSPTGDWHSEGQSQAALCKPCTSDTSCDDGRPETVDFCNYDLPSPGQSQNGRCDARRCGECFYDSDCNPPELFVQNPQAFTRRCLANFTCAVVDDCVARRGVNPVLLRPPSRRSDEEADAHYGDQYGVGGGLTRGYGAGNGRNGYGGNTKRDVDAVGASGKTWGNNGNNDNGFYGHDTQGNGQPKTVPCSTDADCQSAFESDPDRDPTDLVWCNNLQQCVRQDCACAGESICERTLNPAQTGGQLISCDLPSANSTDGTCVSVPCPTCRNYTCPAGQPQPSPFCDATSSLLLQCTADADCVSRFPNSSATCVQYTCTTSQSWQTPGYIPVGTPCIANYPSFFGPQSCGISTILHDLFGPGSGSFCYDFARIPYTCPCTTQPPENLDRGLRAVPLDRAGVVEYIRNNAAKGAFVVEDTNAVGVAPFVPTKRLVFKTNSSTVADLPRLIAPKTPADLAKYSPIAHASARRDDVGVAAAVVVKREVTQCPRAVCDAISCSSTANNNAECAAKTGFRFGNGRPSECDLATNKCTAPVLQSSIFTSGQTCAAKPAEGGTTPVFCGSDGDCSPGFVCTDNACVSTQCFLGQAGFCPSFACGSDVDGVCLIDQLQFLSPVPQIEYPCDCVCVPEGPVCETNADCDDRSTRTTDVCRQDQNECVNVACAECTAPPPKYAARGPYKVGLRTFTVPNTHPKAAPWSTAGPFVTSPYAGLGMTINVYYPVDSTVGLQTVSGAHAYNFTRFINPKLLARPGIVNTVPLTWTSLDLYWNGTLAAQPSNGTYGSRWPVVLYAHRFFSFPGEFVDQQVDMASWGFVVVEPLYIATSVYAITDRAAQLGALPGVELGVGDLGRFDTQRARQFVVDAATTTTSVTGSLFTNRVKIGANGAALSSVVDVGSSDGATLSMAMDKLGVSGLVVDNALTYIVRAPVDLRTSPNEFNTLYHEPILETPFGGLIVGGSKDTITGDGPQNLFDVVLGNARMLVARGFNYSIGLDCTTLPSMRPIGAVGSANLQHWYAANNVFGSADPAYVWQQYSGCYGAASSSDARGIVSHAFVAQLRRAHGLDRDGAQLSDATLCHFNRTAYIDQQVKCRVAPQCSDSLCDSLYANSAWCAQINDSNIFYNATYDARLGRCQAAPFSLTTAFINQANLGEPCIGIETGANPGAPAPPDSCVAGTIVDAGFGGVLCNPVGGEQFKCSCKCYDTVDPGGFVTAPGTCRAGCHDACGVCPTASGDPVCNSGAPQSFAYWRSRPAEWSYETKQRVLCAGNSTAKSWYTVATGSTAASNRWMTLAQQYVAGEQNALHNALSRYPRCQQALSRAAYVLDTNCGTSLPSSLNTLFDNLRLNIEACNNNKECANAAGCNNYGSGSRTCVSSTGTCSPP